jgi:hypothetical protein
MKYHFRNEHPNINNCAVSGKNMWKCNLGEMKSIWGGGLGLWCFTLLSTIFHLYRCGQFYWWRKQEKTTDMPQNSSCGHLPEWPFKKLKKLWLWYLLRSGFIHFLLKSGRHKKMYTNQIKMFVSFPYFYWNALMGNTLTALH